MKKPIAIDLETIPNPECIPLLKPIPGPEVPEMPKLDTRLKDPEKIAADKIKKNIAWAVAKANAKADHQAKKQKQIDDMGFKPHQNLIVCAGWYDGESSGSFFLPWGGSEKHLLEEYWDHLSKYNMFYTFNGLSFDVPALQIHSARHRVKPPIRIDQGRYQVSSHLDCRAILGNWNPMASGSLDYYIRYFGLGDGKGGMSGDKVRDFYMAAGGEAVIRNYCENDCRMTFALAEHLLRYWNF
jgi:predicted PolB exonuclease-like 3'-5' exonuclease